MDFKCVYLDSDCYCLLSGQECESNEGEPCEIKEEYYEATRE